MIMWEAIKYVRTTFALIAFIVANIKTVVHVWLKQQVKLLQTLPENERAEYLAKSLETYHIKQDNLTREQKYVLMRNVLKHRSKRFLIIALSSIAIIAVVAVAVVISVFAMRHANEANNSTVGNNGTVVTVQNSPGTKLDISPALPKATTLVLIEGRSGVQTIDGSIHEFTLSNPLSGLAFIESVEVDVLKVVEDKWATTQALVEPFKRTVNLDPTGIGRKEFARDFKYSPGEVDKFSVLFTSKGGFDYFLRFVITWNDHLTQTKKTICSDVQLACFPDLENASQLTRNEIGERSEQHTIELKRQLEKLRETVKKCP